MSVTELDPQLAAWHPRWKRIRDVIDGSWSVKAGRENYLPRARARQGDDEYLIYHQRTSFYPAASRTAECRKGLMFAANNRLICSDKFLLISDVISRDLQSVRELYDDAIWETLQTNYTGILVDHEQAPQGAVVNAANAIDQGYHPFLQLYPAETILRPTWGKVRGKRGLIRITLQETATRILELALENGVYVQRVWDTSDGVERVVQTVTPTRRGQPFDEIPFVILSDSTRPYPQTGQLEDLVQLNLDHYQATGALTMLEIYGSGVMPVVTGAKPAQDTADGNPPELQFGTGGVLILPDPQAKAFYLEPEGHMAESLRRTIEQLEQQMAKAGARLITADKAAPEAPEVVLTEKAGEDATTANLTLLYQRRLDKALSIAADWLEEGATASYTLNTDYANTTLSAEEMTALSAARQAGDLSSREVFEALKRGKRIAPEKSWDEHRAEVEQDDRERPTTETL